jgi:hypothetical protein
MFKSARVWKVGLDVPVPTYVTIDGTVNAYHVALREVGTPPVKRQIIEYPAADGGVAQSFRLEPRRLVWELFVQADTEAAFEAKRDAVYELFKPTDTPIKIWTDGTSLQPVRQLDALVNGPIDFQQSTQLGYSALVKVPLYAPSPLWYSPTQSIFLTTLLTSGFGATFTYSGNHEEYPIIEIDGMVQDLVLWQTTTLAFRTVTTRISLQGVTIPAGVTYTINLRPGIKRVIDSSFVNRTGEMADPSWVDFRLWPAPLRANGQQAIFYTYTAKDANAKFRTKVNSRYVSY